jgi:ABC-2 type transport system permease protein
MMNPILRKAVAFIRRDFQIESSYKMSFVMTAVDSMMILVFFYFLSALVATGESQYVSHYGGNYLSFAVVGVAFARYFQLTLRMFSDSIRAAQLSGCLEAMLSSQTDSLTIVLMSSLYALISGALQPLLILVAGVAIMGVNLSRMNVPATVVVLAFSLLTFVAFGVLSAATILWLKKGDPLAWILGGMGTMLGGAYFPIEVLPGWLQKVSFLIPITYSLDALRSTMLKGYSLEKIAGPMLTLGLMAAILLPASLAVFAAAVRKGRIEGTLTQY